MAYRKHILFLLLACLLASSQGYANTPYQPQFLQLQELHKTIVQKNIEIQTLQKKLNDQGEQIETSKNITKPSLFQKMQLQKQMQEAQNTSMDLDQKYKEKAKVEDRFLQSRSKLLRSIEGDLAKTHLHEKSHTQALMKLHQKTLALDVVQPEQKKNPSSVAISMGDEDPSALQERFIVLQDLAMYTQGLIKQAEQELRFEKQQQHLRRELSHLMNEEVFFGEQGFIQGTARKQNNTQIGAIQNDPNRTPTDGQDSPLEPEVPLEPVVDPDIPADPLGDVDLEIPNFEQPVITQNFDNIDPKALNMMIDSSIPSIPFSDPMSFQNNSNASALQNNWVFQNDLGSSLHSISPNAGESKRDFLARKLSHLQKILNKIEKTTNEIKPQLENN